MAEPRLKKQRHVVIVGGGAAGMSCASTLANHSDEFKVTVLEKSEAVGGQASSIPLEERRFGASWMNNGVQGGSQIFKHTFKFFNNYGYSPQKVQLQVSFGKGSDNFWTNVFPSPLTEHYASDIRRFGLFLKLVKWTLPLIGLVPIHIMLWAFLFKKDFGDKMVYPLIALFLGTGNQTANVPCGIVERLFDDPHMKLWEYDRETLLTNLPDMYTFDNLGRFYTTWKEKLQDKGVTIRTNTEVCSVLSRSRESVILRIKDYRSDIYTDEEFDELVLCTLADDSLRILGKEATWRERFVLGGAVFYDDMTITHSDREYFENHYETRFQSHLCANPTTEKQRQQVLFAKSSESRTSGFRPMYFTYCYDKMPRLVEMSFNCSNYQHQLVSANAYASQSLDPVYQTIFLDKRRRNLWTIEEIDHSKVIKRNWWHQLGHRWQHYLRVVPLMMFINGRNKTLYAGSWTMVNMHELACVSGIAAAYQLGAKYEKFDNFASEFFAKYLLLSHGAIFSRKEAKRSQRKT